MLTGAARRLLASPWFAAGAGFVIATTAFIVAPRAELKLPNNAIIVTHCKQSGCQTPVPQGLNPQPLGGSSEQVSIPPTIGYRVLWHQQGAFLMEINLASKQAVGHWQLAFTISSAAISSVTGAESQRTGAGRVTVTGSSSGEDGRGQGDIRIFVIGRGSASEPTQCVLNGSPCRFGSD